MNRHTRGSIVVHYKERFVNTQDMFSKVMVAVFDVSTLQRILSDSTVFIRPCATLGSRQLKECST